MVGQKQNQRYKNNIIQYKQLVEWIQIYELPQEIGNNQIFVAIIKVREDFCVLNLEIFTQ